MTDVTYLGKDQNWQEESTTYWFRVDNCRHLTYSGEVIGVVEGRNAGLVWDDSDPIPQGDTRDHLADWLEVTDEMRAAQ